MSTFAGSTQGYADGQGTSAQFDGPRGITIDSDGNFYVADSQNHRIRKIDTAGNVTTVAGSSMGNTDGQGTSARFSFPSDIAIDSGGNFYVADNQNFRIRKIDTDGNVTTVAGSSYGYADGQGTSAQFRSTSGITIDSDGNLYVADTGNHRIRKIDAAGNVTTVAGSGATLQRGGYADGEGASAEFDNPTGIAIDSGGNLYVTEVYMYVSASSPNTVSRIRKIDTEGYVTTIAGSSHGYYDGKGNSARFSGPNGIAIDSDGNLYVTDSGNHRIRKLTFVE